MATATDVGVVNYGPAKYSVELRDIPRATIRPDEVLLEVKAVGVCGSDLHMWESTHSWPMNYPVVLGHEFGGVIRDVGSGVTGWQPGDRVVSETAAMIDANSPLTRQGLYNLDPGRKGYGAAVDGAMRHFVPVPQRILHRVPDNLPFEKAALTEPCCVAYNAVVNNGKIKPGDRILVMGPGPIGLLCAAMARLSGAIVGVSGLERDRERLKVAEFYGCEALTSGLKDWALAGDGLGVDGVVDAAGVSATLKASIDLVRPGGWISKVGWGPQPLDFSLDPLVQKNITLQGSFSHNWPIWERVLRLLSTGLLNIDPVIGGVWSLEKWREAFEEMHSGRIVKAVLKPTA
jgi:alcohol dehydrogenase/L-iditol 2-dehydrogenase